MASSKICFGSTKDDSTKDVVMTAEISTTEITLKTIKGDFYYNSTYPSYNSLFTARNGKVYLTFEGENSDYQDTIMVDQVLLNDSTEGLIQIRARGEGFFNSVFFCKDASK